MTLVQKVPLPRDGPSESPLDRQFLLPEATSPARPAHRLLKSSLRKISSGIQTFSDLRPLRHLHEPGEVAAHDCPLVLEWQ
jgi:hypothetical protein